ncbi:hypothetical protein G9A89_009796 [Geosiphon pyriformis]|nr:hypothetical protein G9A89_009796 [Geosiphon pyriformis]
MDLDASAFQKTIDKIERFEKNVSNSTINEAVKRRDSSSVLETIAPSSVPSEHLFSVAGKSVNRHFGMTKFGQDVALYFSWQLFSGSFKDVLCFDRLLAYVCFSLVSPSLFLLTSRFLNLSQNQKLMPSLSILFLVVSSFYLFSIAAFQAEWKPPGENDKRSPCPGLNVLANHGYLPHDGKDLNPAHVRDVLNERLGISKGFAFTMAGVAASAIGKDGKFSLDDLSKHNMIEHDASLTRTDFELGDNQKVNETLVDQFLSLALNGKLTLESLALARNLRFEQSERENPKFKFGEIQRLLAFGEAAIFLLVIGGQTNREVDVKLAETFFREERLPDDWRPAEKEVTFWDVSTLSRKINNRSNELKNRKN